MNRRINHWILIALAVAVAAPSAEAFKRSKTSGGVPLFWDDTDLPLAMILNNKGSADDKAGSLNACDDAAEAWNDVTNTSFEFENLKRKSTKKASDTQNSPDFKNVIVWRENNFPDEFGNGVLAVTLSWFFTSNGEFVDADIVVNGEDFTFSTNLANNTFDVFTVILHEKGHVLGLDHVNKRSAVMYPFIEDGQRKQLSNDEVKGVRAIYPP